MSIILPQNLAEYTPTEEDELFYEEDEDDEDYDDDDYESDEECYDVECDCRECLYRALYGDDDRDYMGHGVSTDRMREKLRLKLELSRRKKVKEKRAGSSGKVVKGTHKEDTRGLDELLSFINGKPGKKSENPALTSSKSSEKRARKKAKAVQEQKGTQKGDDSDDPPDLINSDEEPAPKQPARLNGHAQQNADDDFSDIPDLIPEEDSDDIPDLEPDPSDDETGGGIKQDSAAKKKNKKKKKKAKGKEKERGSSSDEEEAVTAADPEAIKREAERVESQDRELEALRQERQRLIQEKQRLQQEKQKLEQEKERGKAKQEKLEKERLEKEKREAEKKERIEKEQQEKERAERDKEEKRKRMVKEKLEQERLAAKEKKEQERLEKERLEKERQQKQKEAEKEKKEAEKEKERQREAEKERLKEAEREKERQREAEKERQREAEKERQREAEKERQREAEREKQREAEREKERQREAEKERLREAEREKKRLEKEQQEREKEEERLAALAREAEDEGPGSDEEEQAKGESSSKAKRKKKRAAAQAESSAQAEEKKRKKLQVASQVKVTLDENEECVICLLSLEAEKDKSAIVKLSCGCAYKFHRACVEAWFAKKDQETCPMCNSEVVEFIGVQLIPADKPSPPRQTKETPSVAASVIAPVHHHPSHSFSSPSSSPPPVSAQPSPPVSSSEGYRPPQLQGWIVAQKERVQNTINFQGLLEQLCDVTPPDFSRVKAIKPAVQTPYDPLKQFMQFQPGLLSFGPLVGQVFSAGNLGTTDALGNHFPSLHFAFPPTPFAADPGQVIQPTASVPFPLLPHMETDLQADTLQKMIAQNQLLAQQLVEGTSSPAALAGTSGSQNSFGWNPMSSEFVPQQSAVPVATTLFNASAPAFSPSNKLNSTSRLPGAPAPPTSKVNGKGDGGLEERPAFDDFAFGNGVNSEEAHLVVLAKSGNAGAFTQLFTLHQDALRGSVKGLLQEDRKEMNRVVEETKVRAKKNLGSYKFNEAGIFSWFYQIAADVVAEIIQEKVVSSKKK